MARLTIYKDTPKDTTAVSNLFIDEYMTDANDTQLKVYLYLLRMLNAGQATSVSDMADKFNDTEKDILRALKYWEGRQLLCMDYDSNGNLVSIRLCELCRREELPCVKEDTASSSRNNLPTVSAATAGSENTASKNTTASAPVAAPSADPQQAGAYTAPDAMQNTGMFEKPVYTTKQLQEFKDREETAELLFIAQSYIGKPLTPGEMKSILFFMDVLHFSYDLIDYLLQYCVDKGKKDFKYIEKVAINWAEEGITTPRQAQQAATRYDKNVYVIMNQLGKNTSPTSKELEYINRWTREFGFSNEIIFEACERTVLATDKHRFEYADSILSSWKKEDVRHKSDIVKIDEMYQARRRNASKTTANKFNQFTQNNYDFAQLERELLSN